MFSLTQVSFNWSKNVILNLFYGLPGFAESSNGNHFNRKKIKNQKHNNSRFDIKFSQALGSCLALALAQLQDSLIAKLSIKLPIDKKTLFPSLFVL